MRRSLLTLLILFACQGCGGGGVDNSGSAGAVVANTTVAPDSTPSQLQKLEGVWGGHFPGSTLEHPTSGVEIRFDRQKNNASIRHGVLRTSRSTARVEQTSAGIKIVFPGRDGSVSTFVGRFIDADTIHGHFSSAAYGDEFDMDLHSAKSVGLAPLAPAPAPSPAVRTLNASNDGHLTLTLEVTTSDGNVRRFFYGLGYYFSNGYWFSSDPYPYPVSDPPTTGPTAVIQSLFFPAWIDLDAYSLPSQVFEMLSVEIPLDKLAGLGPTDTLTFAPDSSSYVGMWPDDYTVYSVKMYWSNTGNDYYDYMGWSTSGVNPQLVEIVYDDKTYRVPYSAGQLLGGFRGVTGPIQ